MSKITSGKASHYLLPLCNCPNGNCRGTVCKKNSNNYMPYTYDDEDRMEVNDIPKFNQRHQPQQQQEYYQHPPQQQYYQQPQQYQYQQQPQQQQYQQQQQYYQPQQQYQQPQQQQPQQQYQQQYQQPQQQEYYQPPRQQMNSMSPQMCSASSQAQQQYISKLQNINYQSQVGPQMIYKDEESNYEYL